jgi:uncharacterized protein
MKKGLRTQPLFLFVGLSGSSVFEKDVAVLLSSRWLALLSTLCVTGASCAQQAELPTVQLQAGMHLIQAEVASEPGQRQIGLMKRPTMPINHGMLFVFDSANVQCFWMKNTLLPLSIAFIADDGVVVNIEDMQPQKEDQHCSKKPIRYALEMNQGWFAKRGIKAGYKIKGQPFIASK